MPTDYAEVFQDRQAVTKYAEVVYAPGSYGAIVGARQRRYLRALVAREFPYRRPVQHDFACGTGRGVRMLAGLVRGAFGYDTSAAMLAQARREGTDADLRLVPAHGPAPLPAAAAGPALVTAFRLLLNVPEAVRDRAVAFAAAALPHAHAGLLVLENHGNRHSLRHLRHRRRAGDRWYAELSHADVAALLDRHGFAVERLRGCALFPQGWYGRRWLRALVRPVDAVLTRLSVADRYAATVLYVARRTRPAPPPAVPVPAGEVLDASPQPGRGRGGHAG
ncbi:hypothetical protein GCM10010124_03830 [Pilimelia terevasa]|uniref:Methyltransferase domain-containing protein n=1 Tax=Pilimelia terevasa TaxID=53372 RepID=A0A8J3BDY7_9ACTN|nr:class I SAM-dependent methyltransferase [Pilimelia terevasa]GGK14528.1 hypothetical protein GCM10010124_03830 [Pilimelia terevasa]